MLSIFKRQRRGSPTAGADAEDRLRLIAESRRRAENDVRAQVSEDVARNQAAINETRRQVSEATTRGQAAENELRRQASDAKGRRQAAENKARHRVGDGSHGGGVTD
jgi:hypothetical protein